MSNLAPALAAPSAAGRTGPRRRLAVPCLALIAVLASAPAVAALGSGGPGEEGPTVVAVRTDATAPALEGIDVSHWQNTIDWARVATAGKTFTIIKATESTDFVDSKYAVNRAGAQAAGLWTGAYHFAQPDASANDAVLEADHFVATVRLGKGDLIPALDLEVSGGLSTAALQAWVTSWLNEVTARVGIRPMIYTSPAFWRKYMGDSRALADAGYKTLWIAHWGVTSPTVPASNWGGHGWTFWQYSNCGTVPGITGCVDLDRYNGTDLLPQAYSVFSLAAPSGSQVKQGQSSAAVVDIIRTNFPTEVALDVSGLPAGSSAAFNTSPTTDIAAALTVTTDSAVTPTGTYPLTITGVGDGLTRTVGLSLVVADGIPPTVTAPFTGLVPGTLGTASVPVRVSWTAVDPSGIAVEALQRSVNLGSWRGIALPSATATAVTEALAIGATVQQRARATDRKANTSGWATGPLVRASLTQQGAASVVYSGTWHAVRTSSASGGSLRYSTAAGASATYRFTGSSVAWVAARGPSRGSARIYLDGLYIKTISLRSATSRSRAIVFARNWRTNASHVLRIVVVGTAGHPRVDIDAFVRLGLS